MNADPTSATARERELLQAAREGNDDAFRRLVEPHQKELHAHCYRMLGSVHDADDALQDALLRAWRGLATFERRSSVRSWLYRITTNTCLDLISRRPKRVLPIDHGPAADPGDDLGEPLIESVWVEPYADEMLGLEDGYSSPEARYERRESVELAFIAAVQHLPATQRAVRILRDVLGFSAREAAEALDTTVASVNGALRRARKAVADKLPRQSQQATLRALGDDGIRNVVERYIDAWERGDVDAILAMLAEDATFTMPPLPTCYRGRDAIAALPHPLRAPGSVAPTPGPRQRAAGIWLLRLGCAAGELHGAVARRAHHGWHPREGGHLLCHAVHARPRARAVRRRRPRALWPARQA
jgi:RNA polymerase sigma-70 factor, ECF subfamily